MVLRNSDSPFSGSLSFDRLFSGTVLFLLLSGFAGIMPGEAQASAQLMVAPTRVVLAGRNRTASVTLINRGDKPGTFRIKFQRMRMTADGTVVLLKKAKPGQMFADQMVRYAPRQITLEPGQSQVVRLMLRKPPNLPTGEYRSHMLFQRIPSESGSDISQQAGNATGISIRLIPIVGISIPVIVRQGQTSATVALSGPHLVRRSTDGTRALLVLTVRRSGNQSVYGDFTVRFTPAKSGSTLVLGRLNGVAVYTPNKSRSVTIPLQAPHGVRLQNGTLEVEYRSPAKAGNKVLAKASIAIAASGR
jgi:hypothetical protein